MRRLALIAIAIVLFATPAAAFDKILHYNIVYAIAIAHHFSPEDAQTIASASYSLDDNDTTTAYSDPLIASERRAFLNGEVKLSELPHMRSGQVFHALASDPTRLIAEQGHLDRIARAQNDPAERGTPEQKRQRELLYFGEYLHFVADLVVHPSDPLVGHGPKGHIPDRADLNPDKMLAAIALLDSKVNAFCGGPCDSANGFTPQALRTTQRSDFDHVPGRLDPNDDTDILMRKVAGTVIESWRRTYPAEMQLGGPSSTVINTIGGDAAAPAVEIELNRYSDDLERQRLARAASEIGNTLRSAGLPDRVYDPIVLDSDGEPADAGKFGSAARVDLLGFASHFADKPELVSERENEAIIQALRSSAGGAADSVPGMALARGLTEDAIANLRRASAWVPPSSPGGVALNPRLEIPLDDIGTPVRIEGDGDALYLVTDRGRYRFGGVSARSFATLARTVAAGEIPYLSIGSEPSDRQGFARVTYAPSLRGTTEGLLLYQADVQFKTLFANLPLEGGLAHGGIDPTLLAYPGSGGDFVRLWITSSHIRLALAGDRFVTADSGMRIFSETRLRLSIRSDPEMEAYVDRLNAHWDEIASRLAPFAAVQNLALTTSIVFWARDHGVTIDPLVLMVPPRPADTPLYAPLVAAVASDITIAGGVALTPEDRDTQLGQIVVNVAADALNTSDVPGASRLLIRAGILFNAALILTASLLVPALALFWLLRRAARTRGVRLSFPRALALWAGLCGVEMTAVAILLPLLLGDTLPFFDSDLLDFLLTLVLFPAGLFWLVHRVLRIGDGDALPRPSRFGLLTLGLVGPAACGAAGVAFATTIVVFTGAVPSHGLNTVLTVAVAPLQTLHDAVVAEGEEPGKGLQIHPVPRSLVETFRPPFEHRLLSPGEIGDTIALDPKDTYFPAQTLQRVQWPPDREVPPGVTHYTLDGKPPF